MSDSFVIIAGTEKAGTTALFSFFYNHPQINPSKLKETDYFRKTPNENISRENYLEEFTRHDNSNYLEASPGYLADADKVIAGITKIESGCTFKIIIVLRDPAERIVSSYNFHKSRNYIADNITLKSYIAACQAYDTTGVITEGITEWSLKSFSHGKYSVYLEKYFAYFQDNVMIIDYDEFRLSPVSTVASICAFMNIENEYFANFYFFDANKTFLPKNKKIHTWLIALNKKIAPVFYKYPKLKVKMLQVYKKLNRETVATSQNEGRNDLTYSYRESVHELIEVLNNNGLEAPKWTNRYLD